MGYRVHKGEKAISFSNGEAVFADTQVYKKDNYYPECFEERGVFADENMFASEPH